MLDNSKTGNIVQQNDYKHIILLCKSSAKVVTTSGDKVVTLYYKNGDRRYYFNDFSICHHFLVTRAKLDKSRLWRDLSMILLLWCHHCHHCHQCHHFLVTPLKIIFKKLCNTAKIVTNYTQVLEQIHKGIFRVKNATYLPKPLLEHFVV